MRRKLAYILGGAVFLLIAAAFAFAVFQPIKVLPRIRLSPGFALTDQYGQLLTNEDLRGSLVLYNFTFTACGGPCSLPEQTMRQVQDSLAQLELGDIPVALVSISVDDHDSPFTLSQHARRLGADAEVWRFARSSDPNLLKTVVGAGFEVYYGVNEDGSLSVDPVFVLVDGLGIIRSEYRYVTETPDAERILRHIQVLVEEIQHSVGAARLAYEAAHLFLCYSP